MLIVQVCVSVSGDQPLQTEGETLDEDVLMEDVTNGVRDISWVSIVPSLAVLVGGLDTPFLFHTCLVSAFGSAKRSLLQPGSFQLSPVLLAVQHWSAM